MEGDILGVRLTHAHLRNRRPGRGLTVDTRSGELINIQIPETELDRPTRDDVRRRARTVRCGRPGDRPPPSAAPQQPGTPGTWFSGTLR